ncbi:MAG: hypothetical protein ACYTAO_16775 [Planctomycetota bacterium]|jgi:hypothetical protein
MEKEVSRRRFMHLTVAGGALSPAGPEGDAGKTGGDRLVAVLHG